MKKHYILITGSNGFIGTHLIQEAEKQGFICLRIDKDYDIETLKKYCAICDSVVHLAGVMRPQTSDEFYDVGNDLTTDILTFLPENTKKPIIIFASSTQAILDNDYGKSKIQIEEKLLNFSNAHGNSVFIFRLSNVFGKWGKPNYNSVAATFCNNIAHDLPISISCPTNVVNFIYIDDVINSFLDTIKRSFDIPFKRFFSISPVYPVTLEYLSNKIMSFKNAFDGFNGLEFNGEFDVKLLCEFSSFLPLKLLQRSNQLMDDAFVSLFKNWSFKKRVCVGSKQTIEISLKSAVVEFKSSPELDIKIKHNRTNDSHTIYFDKEGKYIFIPSGYTLIVTNTSDRAIKTIFYVVDPYLQHEGTTGAI